MSDNKMPESTGPDTSSPQPPIESADDSGALTSPYAARAAVPDAAPDQAAGPDPDPVPDHEAGRDRDAAADRIDDGSARSAAGPYGPPPPPPPRPTYTEPDESLRAASSEVPPVSPPSDGSARPGWHDRFAARGRRFGWPAVVGAGLAGLVLGGLGGGAIAGAMFDGHEGGRPGMMGGHHDGWGRGGDRDGGHFGPGGQPGGMMGPGGQQPGPGYDAPSVAPSSVPSTAPSASTGTNS